MLQEVSQNEKHCDTCAFKRYRQRLALHGKIFRFDTICIKNEKPIFDSSVSVCKHYVQGL